MLNAKYIKKIKNIILNEIYDGYFAAICFKT
jgi:hypothetical protein